MPPLPSSIDVSISYGSPALLALLPALSAFHVDTEKGQLAISNGKVQFCDRRSDVLAVRPSDAEPTKRVVE